MPKWFGERPGKKSGDPDSPDDEEDAGGADAAPADDYAEEEEEEEVILLWKPTKIKFYCLTFPVCF